MDCKRRAEQHVQPVIVGKCAGAYATQGWLKILSYTRPKTNILSYAPWFIKQHDTWCALRLVCGKPQGQYLVASVAEINSRDDALSVVGAEIAVQSFQLPPLAADEFYWHDLLGLRVVNVAGETLGVVADVMETGANDVLVVTSSRGRILIPYVKNVTIKQVDLEQGIVAVDWR